MSERAGELRKKATRFLHPSDLRRAQELSAVWGAEIAAAGEVLARRPTARALFDAESTKPKEGGKERISTGSGFVVSREGHVLTNRHVVDGCGEIRIQPAGKVELVARDSQADLALVKLPKPGKAVARFRSGAGVRPGDTVVSAGFPLQGLLTSDLHITTGNVSALAGIGNDRRVLQMTVPIQPGNSGGPVLDLSGHVIGISVSKLNAMRVQRMTGDIPQNVNFAVKAEAATRFLKEQGVEFLSAPSSAVLSAADVGAKAKAFTVIVECWE